MASIKKYDYHMNVVIKKLNRISNFKTYNEDRNTLSYSTTNLSAYLNFGCISIREVYHMAKQELGNKNEIIKQLYWRDFYLLAVRKLQNGNEYKHMDDRYNK